MKFEIDLDIPAAIASALRQETLGPIIEKHILAAVDSAIANVTGYRSAFSEALTTQLAQALPHGLKLRDVAKFQQVLNQSLAGLVEGMNADAINAALHKVAQIALPDVPATVKLSELLEEARSAFHKQPHESFFADWEPSTNGYGYLFLNSEPLKPMASLNSAGASKYNAKYQLGVTDGGEVYTLRLDGCQITPASRPDVITRFHAILMSMYVGRTRLEVDMDSDAVVCAAGSQAY